MLKPGRRNGIYIVSPTIDILKDGTKNGDLNFIWLAFFAPVWNPNSIAKSQIILCIEFQLDYLIYDQS